MKDPEYPVPSEVIEQVLANRKLPVYTYLNAHYSPRKEYKKETFISVAPTASLDL